MSRRVLGVGLAERRRWFSLEVIESQPSTPHVDILIGMDLLIQVNMIWNGPIRQVDLTS